MTKEEQMSAFGAIQRREVERRKHKRKKYRKKRRKEMREWD